MTQPGMQSQPPLATPGLFSLQHQEQPKDRAKMLTFVWATEVAGAFPSCRNSPRHRDAAAPSHLERTNRSRRLGTDGGRI